MIRVNKQSSRIFLINVFALVLLLQFVLILQIACLFSFLFHDSLASPSYKTKLWRRRSTNDTFINKKYKHFVSSFCFDSVHIPTRSKIANCFVVQHWWLPQLSFVYLNIVFILLLVLCWKTLHSIEWMLHQVVDGNAFGLLFVGQLKTVRNVSHLNIFNCNWLALGMRLIEFSGSKVYRCLFFVFSVIGIGFWRGYLCYWTHSNPSNTGGCLGFIMKVPIAKRRLV